MAQEDGFIRETASNSGLDEQTVRRIYNVYYNGSIIQFYDKINEEIKKRKDY